MGAKLFFHAISTILRNFKQAVMASLIPILIGTALIFGFFFFVVSVFGPNPPFFLIVLVPVILAAILFLFSWIAVNWHRYILLEEEPKLFPDFKSGFVSGYVGKSFKLFFWFLLIMVPVLIVLSLVALPFLGDDNFIGTNAPDYGADDALFELIFTVIFTYLWFRYALILPSIALGKNMTLREAREATAHHSGKLLMTSCLMALTFLAINIFVLYTGPLAVVIEVLSTWFVLMLGIGILTTLYGHLVEGRPLPD